MGTVKQGRTSDKKQQESLGKAAISSLESQRKEALEIGPEVLLFTVLVESLMDVPRFKKKKK